MVKTFLVWLFMVTWFSALVLSMLAIIFHSRVAAQAYPEPECEDYGTYVECEDDLVNGKSYRPLIEPGSSGQQGNTVNTKTLPGQSSCLGQGLPNCYLLKTPQE